MKKPFKRRQRHNRRIEQRVADAAEEEGLRPDHLLKFPDILESHGIDPTKVTHGVANRARELNRQAFNDLLEKYGVEQ